MGGLCAELACVACGSDMEQVLDVPVLQSLRGHVVHRCRACGHILLVQEDRAAEAGADWLAPLMELEPGISCVVMI